VHILRALLVIAVPAMLATAALAEDAKPMTFELGGLKVQVAPPAGWQVNDGPPPAFFDFNGQKGNISFVGQQMPGTNADTFAIMHKAALDAGTAQVKAGMLKTCTEKSVDGFKGVLTIEAAKDPSIRRMQWVGYGRGGFYTIMMSSSGDAFDGYSALYAKFLDSVKFLEK
jgi:hypothetical protein